MKLFLYSEKTLDFKPISTNLLLLVVISLLSVSHYLFYQMGKNSNNIISIQTVDVDTIHTVHQDTLEFTEENFKKALYDFNIKFPEYVFKQAKLESGNFSSNIFRENNNCFGFKVHPRRWTGVELDFKNRDHLVFSHWLKSVEQYKLYQDANFTEKHYRRFLAGSGYAEVTNYTERF